MNEEDFDNINPMTNKEYRVNEINPELHCAICPPNRGENYKRDNYRLHKRRPKQKERAKNEREGRKFKRRQHWEVREEQVEDQTEV